MSERVGRDGLASYELLHIDFVLSQKGQLGGYCLVRMKAHHGWV